MNYEGYLQLFLKHFDELRARTIRILELFGVLFIIFLVFDIRTVSLAGMKFPFFYPDFYTNLGAQFLFLIEAHVLPHGYTIITLRPTDGIVADLYSCMFLALIFTVPLIVDQLGKFLSPGLKKSELLALKSVVIPGSLLFVAGALMGLWIVAPPLFSIFYQYDLGLGAQASLNIMNFVSFILLYVLTFGIAFEVPVFMVMLTRFGLVTSAYWWNNWRYAVVGALIFGLIFSPGVIGFTMVMLALPIIALYFGGIYFARRAERRAAMEAAAVADA